MGRFALGFLSLMELWGLEATTQTASQGTKIQGSLFDLLFGFEVGRFCPPYSFEQLACWAPTSMFIHGIPRALPDSLKRFNTARASKWFKPQTQLKTVLCLVPVLRNPRIGQSLSFLMVVCSRIDG